MSKWIQKEEMPPTQRFAMGVNSAVHPNLAKWLWSLPYGAAAPEFKDALEQYAIQKFGGSPQKPSTTRKKAGAESLYTRNNRAEVKDDSASDRAPVETQITAAAVSPAPEYVLPPVPAEPPPAISQPAAVQLAQPNAPINAVELDESPPIHKPAIQETPMNSQIAPVASAPPANTEESKPLFDPVALAEMRKMMSQIDWPPRIEKWALNNKLYKTVA